MNQITDHTEKKYQEIDILDTETFEMLREYSKGNPDLLKDIIDSFEPEGSVIIEEIKHSILVKNPEMLRKSAHSLAGISGSIGAARLKQVCADTENNIKGNREDVAFLLAQMIIPAYTEVVQMLKGL